MEKELEVNPLEKGGNYFATLEGEKFKFNVSKISNVIGRADAKALVDINLKPCGEKASKISRRQALITLVVDGNVPKFVLRNEGKKSIYVNDIQLNMGETKELANNEMIGFPGDVKFLFVMNHSTLNKWLQEQKIHPVTKQNVVVIKDEIITPQDDQVSENDEIEEGRQPAPVTIVHDDLMDIQ
jgi:hypothetical protein